MTKEDLLKQLEEMGPSESNLCEIIGDDRYYQIVPFDQFVSNDFHGYFYILVDERILCIPYTEIDYHNGYKQLSLEDAKIVKLDEVKVQLDEYLRKVELFKEFYSCAQKGVKPSEGAGMTNPDDESTPKYETELPLFKVLYEEAQTIAEVDELNISDEDLQDAATLALYDNSLGRVITTYVRDKINTILKGG